MIAGIWDCLSSQDVVNFVRYQVSKGKELTEIGGMICDHCLAPSTETSGPDIGCDNMTILIVAITHGRSKKEWYTWIKNRVKKNYGYETPDSPPQLYPTSKLKAFQVQKEMYEKHGKSKSAQSASSSTQACSQNNSSASSAPESNAIGWVSNWQRKWTSLLFRLFATISGWFRRKNE